MGFFADVGPLSVFVSNQVRNFVGVLGKLTEKSNHVTSSSTLTFGLTTTPIRQPSRRKTRYATELLVNKRTN